MKAPLTFLSLLTAVFATGTVSAQSFPGKIGNVTIALTISYSEGAYKDADGNPTAEKSTETDTQTKILFKTVLKKAKYSNKEFITDLITKGLLSGAASDWSLKYVDIGYIRGFFAAKKNGQVIYLGGLRVDGDEPIFIQNGAEVTTDDAYVMTNYTSNGESVKSFSYSTTTDSLSAVSLSLRATNDPDHNIEISGLWKKSSGEKFAFVAATNRVTSGYTVSASSFTSLVGDTSANDEESAIVQGAISISPLKDIKNSEDTTAYEEAYPYPPLLDADAA
jgi:hypothetical protein